MPKNWKKYGKYFALAGSILLFFAPQKTAKHKQSAAQKLFSAEKVYLMLSLFFLSIYISLKVFPEGMKASIFEVFSWQEQISNHTPAEIIVPIVPQT